MLTQSNKSTITLPIFPKLSSDLIKKSRIAPLFFWTFWGLVRPVTRRNLEVRTWPRLIWPTLGFAFAASEARSQFMPPTLQLYFSMIFTQTSAQQYNTVSDLIYKLKSKYCFSVPFSNRENMRLIAERHERKVDQSQDRLLRENFKRSMLFQLKTMLRKRL